MLVMCYYRAAMNSVLTAKTFTLPINAFEDLLKTDQELIVARGLFSETFFSFAPRGSILNQIYEEKLMDSRRIQDFENGYDDIVKEIVDNNAIYFYTLDEVVGKEEYPCKITEVKKLRLVKSGMMSC